MGNEPSRGRPPSREKIRVVSVRRLRFVCAESGWRRIPVFVDGGADGEVVEVCVRIEMRTVLTLFRDDSFAFERKTFALVPRRSEHIPPRRLVRPTWELIEDVTWYGSSGHVTLLALAPLSPSVEANASASHFQNRAKSAYAHVAELVCEEASRIRARSKGMIGMSTFESCKLAFSTERVEYRSRKIPDSTIRYLLTNQSVYDQSAAEMEHEAAPSRAAQRRQPSQQQRQNPQWRQQRQRQGQMHSKGLSDSLGMNSVDIRAWAWDMLGMVDEKPAVPAAAQHVLRQLGGLPNDVIQHITSFVFDPDVATLVPFSEYAGGKKKGATDPDFVASPGFFRLEATVPPRGMNITTRFRWVSPDLRTNTLLAHSFAVVSDEKAPEHRRRDDTAEGFHELKMRAVLEG